MSTESGLSKDVALKVLRTDVDPRGQALERLRDEARILSSIRHPSVPQVYDILVLDGRTTMVTEFIEGEDLESLLRAPRIPLPEGLEVLAHVALALQTAWKAKGPDGRDLRLVHRDIKPPNIRVGIHGDVKLLDFGIARAENLTRFASTSEGILGSPAYLPPERFTGDTGAPAGDIFALGACGYELLTGKRLLDGLSVTVLAGLAFEEERFDAMVRKRFAEVRGVNPALIRFFRQMCRHRSSARPTAPDVARTLSDFARSMDTRGLTAWARDRVWREPDLISGPWVSRTLVEDDVSGSVPAPSTPVPTKTLELPKPVPKAAVYALAVVGFLFAMAGAGAGWLLLQGHELPDPQPGAAAPGLAAEVEPEPVPEPEHPVVTAEEPPKPDAATIEPQPSPKPRPRKRAAPVQVEPPPVAAANPVENPPPEPPVGDKLVEVEVTVASATPIVLDGPSGRYTLPAKVPVGEYDVIALDGSRQTQIKRVEVRQQRPLHVQCPDASPFNPRWCRVR